MLSSTSVCLLWHVFLCRQGSYYVLGLPFALVHGREFVAWRQIDPSTLELAVQDIDPAMVRV
jgi:hypothetical protein